MRTISFVIARQMTWRAISAPFHEPRLTNRLVAAALCLSLILVMLFKCTGDHPTWSSEVHNKPWNPHCTSDDRLRPPTDSNIGLFLFTDWNPSWKIKKTVLLIQWKLLISAQTKLGKKPFNASLLGINNKCLNGLVSLNRSRNVWFDHFCPHLACDDWCLKPF